MTDPWCSGSWSMVKRRGVVLLLILAPACGGRGTATSPSPTPTTTTTFSLSGTVSRIATSTGISGATVSIADGSNAGKSTTTDGSGNYSLTGLQQEVFTINVSAPTYLSASRGVRLISNQPLNISLSPIPVTSTFHVSGIATDDDGAPVVGATVTVSACCPPSSVSTVTDGRGSYSVDFDATHSAPDLLPFADVNADSPGHEHFGSVLFPVSYTEKAQNVSMNLHLYRIKRITAGESTAVTVVPGDTLCGVDDELTCRTVRVVIPTDGVLTMSCNPHGDDNGGFGLTIVGYNGRTSSALPWHATAGTERAVDIGMWFTSTVSQSCVFTTSLSRQ
jgi:hypothetical protein